MTPRTFGNVNKVSCQMTETRPPHDSALLVVPV